MALYRLLDASAVFAGDGRVTRLFTLIPGSDFGVDTLAAIEAIGGRLVPWEEARAGTYDLVVAASPKGDVGLLRGRHVLLPHGAGFNKTIPTEGSADSASGLDPVHLLRQGGAEPIALHAVAHPEQVARLVAASPQAARRAKVIGDPTLERVLASRSLRDHYRATLGTGPRRLLALTSTWGPESLLHRHPDLPARLTAHLPYDEYQLALIVHPNERSRLGTYELTQRLAPALDAGLVLTGPYEEWGSVLVAADALLTDHGSTALYFAAAGDRPMVSVGHAGGELIPGSAMDELLRSIPELGPVETVQDALEKCPPGAGAAAARAAFAYEGSALRRLRGALYELVGLAPPAHDLVPRTLPAPTPAARVPTAFDVHVELSGADVRVVRHPAGAGPPGHHLAVEHGAASEQLARAAGVLYRRPEREAEVSELAWSAGGWTEHALARHPGCRVAAAILAHGRRSGATVVLRVRNHGRPYAVRVQPRFQGGQIARLDPAVALSAVHAWLLSRRAQRSVRSVRTEPAELSCLVGERTFRLLIRPATDQEVARAV